MCPNRADQVWMAAFLPKRGTSEPIVLLKTNNPGILHLHYRTQVFNPDGFNLTIFNYVPQLSVVQVLQIPVQ